MKNLHEDVVVRDAVAVRQLSGLSGAQVFLMTKDSRHWFVRKAAQTPENSPRCAARHKSSWRLPAR